MRKLSALFSSSETNWERKLVGWESTKNSQHFFGFGVLLLQWGNIPILSFEQYFLAKQPGLKRQTSTDLGQAGLQVLFILERERENAHARVVCVRTCTLTSWSAYEKSEDNLQDLVLSFRHVGPGYWMQVIGCWAIWSALGLQLSTQTGWILVLLSWEPFPPKRDTLPRAQSVLLYEVALVLVSDWPNWLLEGYV